MQAPRADTKAVTIISLTPSMFSIIWIYSHSWQHKLLIPEPLLSGFCAAQALRAKAEAGDKAAALELAEDDELFRQHMDPDEAQRLDRAKIRRVDPTVDLAADGNDRWSESMTARSSSKVSWLSVEMLTLPTHSAQMVRPTFIVCLPAVLVDASKRS